MFGFMTGLKSRLHIPTIEEREHAYLCGARDRYDLEHRQREIDRGLFRTQRQPNWL